MNCRPNNAVRSSRCGRSKVIGVILSDISNKFFADIARGIENRAFESGYSTFFGSTDESAERLSTLVEVFLNKGVDGLIVVPCEGSEGTIRSIAERDVPLMLLDRTIAGEAASGPFVPAQRRSIGPIRPGMRSTTDFMPAIYGWVRQ